jgi:phosphomethylpyrimidine synthase
MKITEHVRKYAVEQGIAEDKALDRGLKEKAAEFGKKARKFTRKHNHT